MRAAGLFFSHTRSVRIERHFARLVRETEGLIDWRHAFNPGNAAAPIVDFDYEPPESCLPVRYREMLRNGGVQNGLMDVAILPCVLALDADVTWVIEYDVDFSGDWRRLFEQFTASPADLLTSTLLPLAHSPDWPHWAHASAPPAIDRKRLYRGFHPLMRMSRRCADGYRRTMADPAWSGHYEFTLPTAALASGLTVEDIGAHGPLCPPARWGKNYRYGIEDGSPYPGTFVWRPARPTYFEEMPDQFALPDMLYHPVKPDVPTWERPPAP